MYKYTMYTYTDYIMTRPCDGACLYNNMKQNCNIVSDIVTLSVTKCYCNGLSLHLIDIKEY